MPAGPYVSGGALHGDGRGPVPVGGPAWFRWLDAASSTSVRVEDTEPAYTARRENRGTGGYWYAYHRGGGSLRKAYLGRSADLTAERLQDAAEQLGSDAGLLGVLIGRREAVVEIRRLLRRTRFVTLVGPGGVGKSRLAAEVVRLSAPRFPDGVATASAADPDRLAAGVARALGLPEERPAALAGRIGPRRALVVLDGCEHAVDAVGAFAAELLARCPGVRVLATSRLPVGGTVRTVEPLAVPDLSATDAEVLACASGRLFRARARLVRPAFAVTAENAAGVARMCRRLDGMPLAIEIAASRLGALPLDVLADRLDDVLGAPGSSLRDVVAWSHTQLDGTGRTVFARLAVFAGSFDVDAAVAVCADPALPAGAVLDAVTRLVELSLLQGVPGGRLRMLAVVRGLAADGLAARPDRDAVRDRHAAHLLALAERADPMGYDRVSERLRRDLAADTEDLRVALDRLLSRPDRSGARRMGSALALFWLSTAAIGEGRARMGELLALPGDPGARLLLGAGLLAAVDGDYRAARDLLDQGLAAARRDSDGVAEANGCYLVGLLAWWRRDYVGAAEAAAAGERVGAAGGRRAGEGGPGRATARPGLVGLNIWIRAQVAAATGDGDAARRLAERALELCTAADHPLGVALSRNVMGQILLDRGEPAAAVEHLVRALAECRTASWPAAELSTVLALTWAALAQGDLDEARGRAEQGLALWRDQLGPGRLSQPVEAFALLAEACGQPARCLRLATAAAGLRAEHRVEPAPAERVRLAAAVDRARRALGPERAATAEAAGRVASVADVLADAVATGGSGPSATTPDGPAPDGTAPDVTRLPGLTPRQSEVARLVATGLANRAVAARLRIAEPTVERHLVTIFRELGIGSRTQLAAWVARRR